jgi:hypothetical protein
LTRFWTEKNEQETGKYSIYENEIIDFNNLLARNPDGFKACHPGILFPPSNKKLEKYFFLWHFLIDQSFIMQAKMILVLLTVNKRVYRLLLNKGEKNGKFKHKDHR